MDEPLPGWMDDYDRKILSMIGEYGVAIQYVGGDETSPPFAYTVGLAAVQRPEFLIFGLPPEIAHTLLNDLAKVALAGQEFAHGDIVHNLISGYPVTMVEIADPGEHLTMANRLYQPAEDVQVSALQVVFPDKESRFPWEPDSNVATVPLLGPAPDESDGDMLTLPTG